MIDDEEFLGDELDAALLPNSGKSRHKEPKLLVWHKLTGFGHRPGAREGSSAVSYDKGLVLFGGIEAGLRMNSVHKFNAMEGKWQYLDCGDFEPAPRSYHASAVHGKYMFVQGGECTDLWQDNRENDQTRNVCMGDSIAMSTFHQSKHITHSAGVHGSPAMGATLVCKDDMYMLDLETQRWKEIKSSLSPLPRKGHSLTTVTLKSSGGDKRDYLLLFGGLSPDTDAVGNSVHICKVDDLVTKGRCSWRLLTCTGDAPPGRYRHSTTLVWKTPDSAGAPSLLVVAGGLSGSGQVLDDLYTLDLSTLVWSRGGEGGEVEPPAVYGHVAFSAPPVGASMPTGAPGEELQRMSHTSVIIFSGSTNAGNASLDCIQKMYAYDVMKRCWSVAESGFEYPAQRSGHVAAMIWGWAPANDAPVMSQSDNSSSASNLKALASRAPAVTNKHSATALVFGGLNSSAMCRADVWALDLQWRPSGVAQFDDSIGRIGEREIMRITQGKSGAESVRDLHQLAASASESDMMKMDRKKKARDEAILRSHSYAVLEVGGTSAQTINLANDNPAATAEDMLDHEHPPEDVNDFDLEELGSAIHKVRREKILADLQTVMERERADKAEEEVGQLRGQLVAMQLKMQEMEEAREGEASELRKAIELSVAKARKLEIMNEEAYHLLVLQGADKILGRAPSEPTEKGTKTSARVALALDMPLSGEV